MTRYTFSVPATEAGRKAQEDIYAVFDDMGWGWEALGDMLAAIEDEVALMSASEQAAMYGGRQRVSLDIKD